MKNVAALVFASLFAVGPAAAQQNETAMFGYGVAGCARYANDVKDDDIFEDLFYAWAMGYMSALNSERIRAGMNTVNLRVIEPEAQVRRINMFCDQNPLKIYLQAVQSVWHEMREITEASATD
jgi:hypothetical protein